MSKCLINGKINQYYHNRDLYHGLGTCIYVWFCTLRLFLQFFYMIILFPQIVLKLFSVVFLGLNQSSSISVELKIRFSRWLSPFLGKLFFNFLTFFSNCFKMFVVLRTLGKKLVLNMIRCTLFLLKCFSWLNCFELHIFQFNLKLARYLFRFY